MANQTTADGGRTDSKRHTDDVSGDDVIEGDRIAPQLVARTPGQLGQQIRSSAPDGDDVPKTQLIAVTEIDRYDDVHRAILVDPETRTFIRASRHDSQSAWTQAEADWTAHEVGSEIVVEDAEFAKDEGYDDVDDVEEYITGWVDVLFDGRGDVEQFHDERRLHGRTLELYNPHDCIRAHADISLED